MHRQTRLDGCSNTVCDHEEVMSPTPQFSYLKNGDSNTDLTLSPPGQNALCRHENFVSHTIRLSLVISSYKNSGTVRTPVPTHSLPCLDRFLKNPEQQEFKLLYHRGLVVPLIDPVHSLMFEMLMFLTQSKGNKHFIPTVLPIPMNMLLLCPQTLSDIRFPFGGEINEARSGTHSHRF